MKTFRSASHSRFNSIVMLVVGISMLTACAPGGGNSGTSGTGWKVWVKTSPCAGGRTDWISVAKTNPTEGGGGSFWQTADLIQSPSPCTRDIDACTFAAATAAANTIRTSSRFTSYCCTDYSVWRNSGSGEMSVILGKQSTAGPGWMLEKTNLCCEEAETLSGKTGLCGNQGAPPLGPQVRRTPGITNTTPIGNSGGGGPMTDNNCWDCVTLEQYCRKECYMTGTYGVAPSFGDQCAPKGFGDQCLPCWEAKCKGTLYPKR